MKIKKVKELNILKKSENEEFPKTASFYRAKLGNLLRKYKVDFSRDGNYPDYGIREEDFDALIEEIITTTNYRNKTTGIETGYE